MTSRSGSTCTSVRTTSRTRCRRTASPVSVAARRSTTTAGVSTTRVLSRSSKRHIFENSSRGVIPPALFLRSGDVSHTSDAGSGRVDNLVASHHSTGMSQGKPKPGFAEVESRALALEGEQRFEEAGNAFDAALAMNPSSQSASEGRARIALALKEDAAADHCRRALAFHNADPDLQLRMILTVATELGGAAIPLFEDYLHRNPEDISAHERLSELRAEYG